MEELDKEEMLGTEGGACRVLPSESFKISPSGGNIMIGTVGRDVTKIVVTRIWASNGKVIMSDETGATGTLNRQGDTEIFMRGVPYPILRIKWLGNTIKITRNRSLPTACAKVIAFSVYSSEGINSGASIKLHNSRQVYTVSYTN